MDNVNNAIIISDLHCGCQFGLCPPTFRLDGGGIYRVSKFQKDLLKRWLEFWNIWVPKVTRGDPYCVIINGDLMDHRHHGATTQISQNLSDQLNIAYELIAPIAEKCDGLLFIVRGTEAHTGPAAELEEKLANRLNAYKDETGNYSRYELKIEIGKCLVHVSHHIGVTASLAYETSALMAEYANACADAAKWGHQPPDIVVRSHRHRHCEIRVPSKNYYGYGFCTSGWQLKTPFSHRTAGGRVTTPTVGGSLIRQGDEEFFTRHMTWPFPHVKTEKPKRRKK